MQSDVFNHRISRLRDLGGQRVWSLMVSLFGDLAQDESDVIDGPVLTAIMDILQVKPEATRVALHRLRNDGWITSEKLGRISQHALTAKGRAESATASPRIYAKPGAVDQDWQLVLLADATSDMPDAGLTALTNRVLVGPSTAPLPDNAISLKGQTVPPWLMAQIEPETLRDQYIELANTLNELKAAVPSPNHLSSLQTTVLRCLIVHNWRRLILKHPPLPDALVADNWPGRTCHLLVADLLELFPKPALTEIGCKRAAA